MIETMEQREARVVYRSPDGGDLTRDEIAYGPIQTDETLGFKAMAYSFDPTGVAQPRGWAFFGSQLEYETLANDQCDRLARDPTPRFRREWFKVHLPYTLVKIREDIAKHLYLPLNRDYKPLGVSREDFVNYEAYPHRAMRFARHPLTFTDVWTNELYLYNDDTQFAYSAYFNRLARLFSHQIKA